MAGGNDPEKPEGTGKKIREHSVSGELGQRLSRLEAELVKKGALKPKASEEKRSQTSASTAQAMKISSEFIAGIVVGALIGWFIDQVAGTKPWGLVIFLLLGFAAGVLNVLRSTGRVSDNGLNMSGVAAKDKKAAADEPDTK